MSKRNVLGRGLSALIQSAPKRDDGYIRCPVDEIVPNKFQPRRAFDDAKLAELADSIKENGIIEPLVARRGADGGYELIAGERRWRAAKVAGLTEVPLVVLDVTDKECLEFAIIDQQDIGDVVADTALDFLKLVPSTVDLIGAEVELMEDESREMKLKDALRGVVDAFEYIVIDCPPSLSLLTVNALTAAHSVLIPLQCEYYALEGISQIVRTIDLIKNSLNPRLEIEGVLLTMFDSRNNLSHQVAEEVKSHFQNKVFGTVITRNVRLSESPGFGKPVILYDIMSKGSLNYLDLARELLSRN